MQLFARQEDDIASRDPRFLIFRPHVAFAGQYDDGLLVEVAVRRGLGCGYVTDELRDDVGPDPFVNEHLEIARTHCGPLCRINLYDTLGPCRVEVAGHRLRPDDLA